MDITDRKHINNHIYRSKATHILINLIIFKFFIFIINFIDISLVDFSELISDIKIIAIVSLLTPLVISFIEKIINLNSTEYDLRYHIYLYDKVGQVTPASDKCIIKHLKNKYRFFLLSFANAITLYNFGSYYVIDFSYIFTVYIVYLILELIFLNEFMIKRHNLYNKYRDLFPEKELDFEELYFYMYKKEVISILIYILVIMIILLESFEPILFIAYPFICKGSAKKVERRARRKYERD